MNKKIISICIATVFIAMVGSVVFAEEASSSTVELTGEFESWSKHRDYETNLIVDTVTNEVTGTMFYHPYTYDVTGTMDLEGSFEITIHPPYYWCQEKTFKGNIYKSTGRQLDGTYITSYVGFWREKTTSSYSGWWSWFYSRGESGMFTLC